MTDLDDALGGDLRTVLELAALAPSVHNSQPWRFVWDGGSLSLYEDRSRALPVLDPAGRERVLSCGAALLNARVALSDLGHQHTVGLLPDPAQPDLLAIVTMSGHGEPDDDERVLAQAIARRTTDRDPFDARRVPAEARTALRLAAEQEGAWLRFVTHEADGDDADDDDAVELQVLLSHADDSQRSDPRYLAELASWRREREAEGVPARALSSVPAELRASTWVPRDFDAGSPDPPAPTNPPPPALTDSPPPAEHPAVLVLGTRGDDRHDWLVAGQALGRVLLRATVDGLAAQPLTQVMEVPVLRARMRHALGVQGHPQMLLRVGYGHTGHTGHTSRRRTVEDFTSVATR